MRKPLSPPLEGLEWHCPAAETPYCCAKLGTIKSVQGYMWREYRLLGKKYLEIGFLNLLKKTTPLAKLIFANIAAGSFFNCERMPGLASGPIEGVPECCELDRKVGFCLPLFPPPF